MAEYREIKCPYGDDFEGGDECDRCEQYELCMETYPPLNLIEVPKGATNGDMIKAMFPSGKYGTNGVFVHVFIDNQTMSFDLSWWNAQYKRGLEQ